MSRVIFGFMIVILTCGLTGGADAQQSLPSMTATLTGTPESYQGMCPVEIRFKGAINTTRPGRVHYKFIRSDGAYAPTEPASFDTSGAREVSTTWTVGTAEQSRYEGWMMLKVVYPNEIESTRVRFKVTCTGMAVDLPDLTVADISLDDQCRVVVKAKNNGPGAVFDTVWTDHNAESPAIKLYVDGRAWGGETIWLLDPQRNLRNPGGTVAFSTTLKVSGTQEIRATIDGTRQVKEKDETNNEGKIALTCKASVPEKQQ